MKDGKTYFDLSEDELTERAALTPSERQAVDAFISAARALPKTLCIDVNSFGEAPQLTISKRLTAGSAQQVAQLTKKSLCF